MAPFNFKEFQQYRNHVEKLSNLYQNWLRGFLLKEGQRFISKVKPRTPVDTGDLRNHWVLTGITSNGVTLSVWFVNPMYYADFVEFGHAKPYKSGATEGSKDWVRGYFMMTVSLDEIEREMPKRFESEFRKYLTSLGVM